MAFRIIKRVVAKTADYSPNAGTDCSGTRFSNRGASAMVTFTLPKPEARLRGMEYTFELQANQSLRVAAHTNGDIATVGNAAANSVGYEIAGNKLGRLIWAQCDGAQWIALGIGAGFCVNGAQVDAGLSDESLITGITAGQATASKAVILDAQSAVAGLKVGLGAGATATAAGGNVASLTDSTSTASGTTQNTEYALNQIALPANALSANGKGFIAKAWGTLAANANAKNVKLYLGATAIATVTGSTASGKDFHVEATVIRTGAGAQIVTAFVWIDTGTSPTFAVSAPALDETTALTLALKTANTAAAAASATGKGMALVFLN